MGKAKEELGHLVNISGFADQTVSVTTAQFWSCGEKTAIDNMYTDECGYGLIKLYVGMLKFEFHIIFLCQTYSSSFDFFRPPALLKYENHF